MCGCGRNRRWGGRRNPSDKAEGGLRGRPPPRLPVWREARAPHSRPCRGDAGRPGHRTWREIAAVLRDDRPDASTAYTVQKKDLRIPRRLPGAAEALPGGVRPVVVGDRPPHRDLSPHRMALPACWRPHPYLRCPTCDSIPIGIGSLIN